MKFGKRLNVSGVAGLLMIPLLILLAIPPLVVHRGWLLHPEPGHRICYTGLVRDTGGLLLYALDRSPGTSVTAARS